MEKGARLATSRSGPCSAPLFIQRDHPPAACFAVTFISLSPQPEHHEFRPSLLFAPGVALIDVLLPARPGPMFARALFLQVPAQDAHGPGFEIRKFDFLHATHVDTTFVILLGRWEGASFRKERTGREAALGW